MTRLTLRRGERLRGCETPDPTVSPSFASRSRRQTLLRRVAVAAGWAGAFLGVCAGVVQLAYGSSIPEWTGDKMDTTGLGLATIGLSVVAGVALWRLLCTAVLWGRVVWTVVALASAVVCFTTVGRLWYVPGPLLIVATACEFLAVPLSWRGPGGRQDRP